MCIHSKRKRKLKKKPPYSSLIITPHILRPTFTVNRRNLKYIRAYIYIYIRSVIKNYRAL